MVILFYNFIIIEINFIFFYVLEFELVKCIRRQNILREPTPPPIDSDEEDSATALLKHNTRLAANVPTIPSRPDGDEVDPELIVFAAKLNLNLAEPEAIESNYSRKLYYIEYYY